MSKRVSVEGIKIPKPSASPRTWNRWIDPMNRERMGMSGDWEVSTNPMCSAGRNVDRFLKRSIVLKNNLT